MVSNMPKRGTCPSPGHLHATKLAKAGVRYAHLLELIFGFLMVFILCQSDIY